MRKTIAFYGPDGTGKTTLARMLRIHMWLRGIETRIFWIRGLHTLALITALFLSRFRSMKGEDIPQLGLRVTDKKLWCILESISLIPLIIKYYILKIISRGIILSERSFIDSIAWLYMYYLGEKPCRILSHLLFSLSLKEYSTTVYVTARPDVIINRRRNIEDLPVKYILKQLAIYNKLHQILYQLANTCRIDTSEKTRKESFKELLQCIDKQAGSK